MTLLARDTSDIHHDVTWLIGALARGLMGRARNPGVLEMLGRLSECDFSQERLTNIPPASAPACAHLPEAVTAALKEAREAASAIAAASEHLPWRAAGDGAALARVLGEEALMEAERAAVTLILLAPGASIEIAARRRDALFFALTGPSRWRSEGAALLALAPGQTLFVSSGHAVRASTPDTPLLAAMISG